VNANHSNKSISPARVQGTEIVRVTGKKKRFLTPARQNKFYREC